MLIWAPSCIVNRRQVKRSGPPSGCWHLRQLEGSEGRLRLSMVYQPERRGVTGTLAGVHLHDVMKAGFANLIRGDDIAVVALLSIPRKRDIEELHGSLR